MYRRAILGKRDVLGWRDEYLIWLAAENLGSWLALTLSAGRKPYRIIPPKSDTRGGGCQKSMGVGWGWAWELAHSGGRRHLYVNCRLIGQNLRFNKEKHSNVASRPLMVPYGKCVELLRNVRKGRDCILAMKCKHKDSVSLSLKGLLVNPGFPFLLSDSVVGL